MNLIYDGTDPVVWVAKVRGLICKLTTRNATPAERTVRRVVLRALEAQYKMRVEIIRQCQPDIKLIELWEAIRIFPYPISKENTVIRKDKMNKSNASHSKVDYVNQPTRVVQSPVSKIVEMKVKSPALQRIEVESKTQPTIKQTEVLAHIPLFVTLEVEVEPLAQPPVMHETEMEAMVEPLTTLESLEKNSIKCDKDTTEKDIADEKMEELVVDNLADMIDDKQDESSCVIIDNMNAHVVNLSYLSGVETERISSDINLLYNNSKNENADVRYCNVQCITCANFDNIPARVVMVRHWHKIHKKGKPCVKIRDR